MATGTQPSCPRPGLNVAVTSWSDMDMASRHAPSALRRDHVPDAPGIYAWYREGKRMYVGKADSLRDRVWGNHLGQSRAPTDSAFRRNVAEHLGFGTPAAIKARTVVLSVDQLAALRRWIIGCEVAWLVCATKADAIALEAKLKFEFKPPLTKT